eukprot:scaffold2550_cov39-Isochrysis_galbana.AAC.1
MESKAFDQGQQSSRGGSPACDASGWPIGPVLEVGLDCHRHACRRRRRGTVAAAGRAEAAPADGGGRAMAIDGRKEGVVHHG